MCRDAGQHAIYHIGFSCEATAFHEREIVASVYCIYVARTHEDGITRLHPWRWCRVSCGNTGFVELLDYEPCTQYRVQGMR